MLNAQVNIKMEFFYDIQEDSCWNNLLNIALRPQMLLFSTGKETEKDLDQETEKREVYMCFLFIFYINT